MTVVPLLADRVLLRRIDPNRPSPIQTCQREPNRGENQTNLTAYSGSTFDIGQERTPVKTETRRTAIVVSLSLIARGGTSVCDSYLLTSPDMPRGSA